MLGFSPIGSAVIGGSFAPTAAPPVDVGTIVSAAGRCSCGSFVAGAAQWVQSSRGTSFGSSTVAGRTNVVYRSVSVNDRIEVNLLPNPFIVELILV